MIDRRSEPRYSANQSVLVTLLDSSGEARPREGRIIDVSGRGMRLLIQGEAPSLKGNAPVKVDLADSLILGELIYCEHRDGCFAIGIEMQHSLANLAKLAGFRARFLGTPAVNR